MSQIVECNEQVFAPHSNSTLIDGPVIVGAGPSGLAVAAGLKQHGVPFVILDKANCVASLWKNRTYDRLKLHLPKSFCQLAYIPFPKSYPQYPTKDQFVDYIESYVKHFDIKPNFNQSVQSAKYDETCGLWRVRTASTGGAKAEVVEYICKWLVVATGENAVEVVPSFEGIEEFGGPIVHACNYKCGRDYEGQKVLVIGCGNTGMEISFDLANHNAFPLMVVKSPVHVLPRDMFGISTYLIASFLLKWGLPLRFVDKILLLLSNLIFGKLENYGIKRPLIGPIELKNIHGKAPVLNTGTLQKIKSGDIKIVPGINKFSRGRVELQTGEILEVDAVIMATGYRSNVASWLQDNEFFSKEGYPTNLFPNGWKGKRGLYAVGFTNRGIDGATFDAKRVSQDIAEIWKKETMHMNNHVDQESN